MIALFAALTILTAHPCAAEQTDVPSADGYCAYGYWTPGELTLGAYLRPAPTHFSTRALYYSPGLMEETAALKGYDGTEDYIALLSPSMVGDRVWIRMPGGDWIPVRVVDDVDRWFYYFHAVNDGSGIEVSNRLAKRLGIIDWMNADGSRYPTVEVCVTESDPNGVCADAPIGFTTWFLSIADYVP